MCVFLWGIQIGDSTVYDLSIADLIFQNSSFCFQMRAEHILGYFSGNRLCLLSAIGFSPIQTNCYKKGVGRELLRTFESSMCAMPPFLVAFISFIRFSSFQQCFEAPQDVYYSDFSPESRRLSLLLLGSPFSPRLFGSSRKCFGVKLKW